MRLAIIYLSIQVLLVFAIISTARAESVLNSDEAMHAVGHTGGSYIITHAGQVICKKIVGQEHKLACLLVSAGTAAAAGTFKEVVLDRGESNKRHAKGFIEDGIGIGAAAAFITIDW